LLRQAYQEVYAVQMEEQRLRQAFERIGSGRIRITWPERLTPFCFPLKVDSGFMRESLTTEQLADRVARLTAQLENWG
jgi:ATP-dependent Lhr-like helicase